MANEPLSTFFIEFKCTAKQYLARTLKTLKASNVSPIILDL